MRPLLHSLYRAVRSKRRALAAGFALTLGIGGLAAPATAASDTPLRTRQLAPGVHVHLGRIDDWLPRNGGDVANLGFVVGSRCVAVIDTGGTPEVGRRLLAAVRAATPLPVCYVIHTHAHPDHALGSVAFRSAAPPPRFVASSKYTAALAVRGRHYLNAMQRDFGLTMAFGDLVMPDMPIERSLELDLGDRKLQLDAWPTAHTDHDLSVYDRHTRTLFLGDLLFVEHLPVIDGRLRGWLDAMEVLRRYDVALAVPGHGAPSREWPRALDPQRDYLGGLAVQVKAAIKSGKTIRETVESIAVPADAGWRLAEHFHRRNVTAAYAELEWED